MKFVVCDREGVEIVHAYAAELSLLAGVVPLHVIVAAHETESKRVTFETVLLASFLAEPIAAFDASAEHLKTVLVVWITEYPREVVVRAY